MSVEDYQHVLALGKRALALQFSGHSLRAGRKFFDALKATAFAPDDCLVVASMQAALAMLSLDEMAAIAAQLQPSQVAVNILLLIAEGVFLAAQACVARRAAGTLLPGTCRPAEEAWRVAEVESTLRVVGRQPPPPGAFPKRISSGVGLTVFADVARAQLCYFAILHGRERFVDCMPPLATVGDMVDDAASLLLQHASIPVAKVWEFQTALGILEARFGDEMPVKLRSRVQATVDRTRRALELMHNSNNWEQSDAYRSLQSVKRQLGSKRKENAAAARAPELLRCCQLASCGAKEAHVSLFSRCAACKTVVYCSREHQVADWPSHKKACKAARKAAAAAAAS